MRMRLGRNLLRSASASALEIPGCFGSEGSAGAGVVAGLFQQEGQLAGELAVGRQGVVAQQHLRRFSAARQRTSALGL